MTDLRTRIDTLKLDRPATKEDAIAASNAALEVAEDALQIIAAQERQLDTMRAERDDAAQRARSAAARAPSKKATTK